MYIILTAQLVGYRHVQTKLPAFVLSRSSCFRKLSRLTITIEALPDQAAVNMVLPMGLKDDEDRARDRQFRLGLPSNAIGILKHTFTTTMVLSNYARLTRQFLSHVHLFIGMISQSYAEALLSNLHCSGLTD